MPTLSEKQAWEYLRNGFKNPVFCDDDGDLRSIKTGSRYSACLCDAVGDMNTAYLIPDKIEDSMLKKIKNLGPIHRTTPAWSSCYWPVSAEGAQLRANFCDFILKEFYSSEEVSLGRECLQAT